MSRRYVLWALFLISTCFPAHAPAQTAPAGSGAVICPKVPASPALDGRLDDWPALPQIVMANADDWRPADSRYAQYGGPQDISADVRLVWDNRALYIAVETRDDSLVRVRSAAEIDRGDSLVFSLGSGDSNETNQLVVALLRGASLVWRAQPTSRAGESRAVGRAILATPEDSGGSRVTYELAIPWPELTPVRPIPGQSFTFGIAVCDDDGAGIKGCLERSVPVTFAGDDGGATMPQPRPSSLTPSFPKPAVARFDRRAFIIHNQPTLLFGGRVDYARLPKAVWADRIVLVRSAGMYTVDVTVPWSYHQPKPNQPDLADLKEFLDLCKQNGLFVQLNLGPYAGGDWEAGGAPGWLLARAGAGSEQAAVEAWYRALLPVVKASQLTAGGPVVTVAIRPLPQANGAVDAGSLQALIELARGAGIEVPLLTANAAAARDNAKQSLSNILDTVAFYSPVSASEMFRSLTAVANEENGPAVVSGMYGDYSDGQASRRSASLVKIALAAGSTDVLVSDFAPGMNPNAAYTPGRVGGGGVVDPAGARTAGFGEMKLVGDFTRLFGPGLVRAVSAEGVIKADDREARVAVRLAEKTGFIFLWDERGAGPRQVRLSYTPPGTTAAVSIPEAGAISLPAGCAKVLVMDVPVSRGLLRYSTSEIAGIHKVGDRTLLVLYGDVDTPGEIALQWPGPPLVSGQVSRQRWDAQKSTLIIDYFHSQNDQYLLVDDLEIAILSRERAAGGGQLTGDQDSVTIATDAIVAGGSVSGTGVDSVIDCPAGTVTISAALPKPPTAVTVDGKPVPVNFTTPARVLTFSIKTASFEDDTRATGLARVGRVILGGPPKLAAQFDRGWFMPEADASGDSRQAAAGLGRAPEALGLRPGSFARLRATFEAAAPARLTIKGSTDAALVSINGRLVPELSGAARERQADIAAFLKPGANRIEIVLDVQPRPNGLAGLRGPKLLPDVALVTGRVTPIANWESASGLAGEADGWASLDVDTKQWHLLRFGPWRAQGTELAEVWGVGWYRVPFGTVEPGAWRIPHYLTIGLHGSATLYLNGNRFADCLGDGVYRMPLAAPPLVQGDANILAAAVYGLGPGTGIDSMEIVADRQRMTRRHTVSIKF